MASGGSGSSTTREGEEGLASLVADWAAMQGDAGCPFNDFTLVSDNGLRIKVLHYSIQCTALHCTAHKEKGARIHSTQFPNGRNANARPFIMEGATAPFRNMFENLQRAFLKFHIGLALAAMNLTKRHFTQAWS